MAEVEKFYENETKDESTSNDYMMDDNDSVTNEETLSDLRVARSADASGSQTVTKSTRGDVDQIIMRLVLSRADVTSSDAVEGNEDIERALTELSCQLQGSQGIGRPLDASTTVVATPTVVEWRDEYQPLLWPEDSGTATGIFGGSAALRDGRLVKSTGKVAGLSSSRSLEIDELILESEIVSPRPDLDEDDELEAPREMNDDGDAELPEEVQTAQHVTARRKRRERDCRFVSAAGARHDECAAVAAQAHQTDSGPRKRMRTEAGGEVASDTDEHEMDDNSSDGAKVVGGGPWQTASQLLLGHTQRQRLRRRRRSTTPPPYRIGVLPPPALTSLRVSVVERDSESPRDDTSRVGFDVSPFRHYVSLKSVRPSRDSVRAVLHLLHAAPAAVLTAIVPLFSLQNNSFLRHSAHFVPNLHPPKLDPLYLDVTFGRTPVAERVTSKSTRADQAEFVWHIRSVLLTASAEAPFCVSSSHCVSSTQSPPCHRADTSTTNPTVPLTTKAAASSCVQGVIDLQVHHVSGSSGPAQCAPSAITTPEPCSSDVAVCIAHVGSVPLAVAVHKFVSNRPDLRQLAERVGVTSESSSFEQVMTFLFGGHLSVDALHEFFAATDGGTSVPALSHGGAS